VSNEVVVKSNYLVEASYKISLNEQRVVLYAISKLDSQGKMPDEITITAQEWLKMFPDIGKEHVHRELKKASDRLWERTIKVVDPKQTKKFRWVQTQTDYHIGEGRVTLDTVS
jgi:plasmid replication initiation protein